MELGRCIGKESSEEKRKTMDMLYSELFTEWQKREEMMQLTEDLLSESSAEATLERIRGLSTDYIPGLLIELRQITGKESVEKREKMRMLHYKLSRECQKREEMMQLTERLLNESSAEARLERIRGLSTDYIPWLLIEELRQSTGNESSEEKRKKMEMLYSELFTERQKREEMMQLTERLLNESSAEARLERIRGLSTDYIPWFMDELKKRSISKESSKEKRKKMEMLYSELFTGQKREEMMQLTERLLNDSSAEARLERIRGLSTDNIPWLLIELRQSTGKESSEEKRKKMEMLFSELFTERQKREEMMQLTEDLLSESSDEARLDRIQALSRDYRDDYLRYLPKSGFLLRLSSGGIELARRNLRK